MPRSQVRKADRARPQFRNRKGDSQHYRKFSPKAPGEGKGKGKVGGGDGGEDGGFQKEGHSKRGHGPPGL